MRTLRWAAGGLLMAAILASASSLAVAQQPATLLSQQAVGATSSPRFASHNAPLPEGGGVNAAAAPAAPDAAASPVPPAPDAPLPAALAEWMVDPSLEPAAWLQQPGLAAPEPAGQ